MDTTSSRSANAVHLGVDIGGTKCAVSLSRADGTILDRRETATTKRDLGWRPTVDALLAGGREMLAAHDLEVPHAIGISCGSPMDRPGGTIEEPANLPGWKSVPIVRIFEEAFPGVRASLENDANAGALAEFAFGAGREHGAASLVFLTFGTGLGAGLVLDGRLYRGANDYAGEIGHVRLAPYGPAGCGKPGSFEGFCSGGGIAQIAAIERRAFFGETTLPYDGVTAKDVGLAAQAGDRLARQVLNVVGDGLGRGLAILVDVLNPELIVIGSIFARAERFLRPAMERALAAEARPEPLARCRIVPATLGERIGDLAALSIALNAEGRLPGAGV